MSDSSAKIDIKFTTRRRKKVSCRSMRARPPPLGLPTPSDTPPVENMPFHRPLAEKRVFL